jgi:sec-independent protein translocase protein TatB
MFDLGWTEMLVIAIVLIIVVGPKDLPAMLRTFGRTMTKLRSMAGEFRSQFDEALKEAELDDVKKTIDEARKLNPTRELRDAINPLKRAGDDLKSELNRSMKDKPAKSATSDQPPVAKKDPSAPAASPAADQSAAAAAASKASSPVRQSAKPAPAASPATKSNGAKPSSPASSPASGQDKGRTAVKAAPKKAAPIGKTPKAPAAKAAKPRVPKKAGDA